MDPLRADLLSDSSARRLRRLADQARDELEDRLRRGEACRSEDLLASYPELAEHEDFALELIGLEFSLRRQLGQAPSLDDYRSRFPQWSEALRLLLAAPSVPTTCGSADQRTLPERQHGTEAARTREVRRLLGHYELLERIGHGGMGDVYRARQCPPLERIVALKLLRTGDEFEVLTFEKEIEVARRLRHPNLLPIYDAGCLDGEYYYTMPLLAGGSLLKRLGRGRPEPRWAAALVEKVARAVHYAHRRGVLHRDLKPANILLDDDEPLVADFGLAKLLDRSLAQTQTGQLLGSVPYMSPEQARGEGHRATPASDVWSLGVILYEMLTGQRPFEGGSHSEIMRRILRIEPFRPRQLQADLPPDLETICLKCLEKDAAWRYRSAEELADDLKRWLDGVPLPPEGLATRFRRALPRSSGRWASVALLVAIMGLVPVAFLNPRSPSPARPAAPEDRRALLLAEEARAEPDRPLLVLAPGKPLRWSRAEVGANRVKMLDKADKPLAMETLSVCLLELLPPSARRRSYRLTVEMRQVDMILGGGVGLYLGRAPYVAAGRRGHTFIKVEFAEPHLRMAAGENLKQVLADQIDRMELGIGCIREPGNAPPQPLRFTGRHAPLPPGRAPNGESLWRTLTLEMTPKTVRLIDGRQQRHELHRPGDLQAAFRILQHNKPDLQNVVPAFAVTGGIGIFVIGGSAEVRSIQFQPLRETP